MTDETRIPGLRRAVRLPSRRIDRDVDEEIAFHIDSRVRELTKQGMLESQARVQAEGEFGDLRASRRELAAVDRHRERRERLSQLLAAAVQDLRYAVRSLRRSPAFTITAVLTLAIGIGASVAIFALVNGVLLRPLPFGNPDRLVAAYHELPAVNMAHQPQTATTFFTYQRLTHTTDGIGVYSEGDVNIADPGGTSAPERLTSAKFSATLIPVLRVVPIIGRAFTAEDDRPGASPVILIGEAMWRERYGADRAVLGRRLDVDGVSREIVGVMPSRFRFPSAATKLWIPLQLDPANPPASAFAYPGVARLKPGVTPADAQRDFARALPRWPELFPNFVPGITTAAIMEQTHPAPSIVPLKADMTAGFARTLWMIAAAALLVLLVACANVANLTLVRAEAHQRELAVRQALGAGRARLRMHFITECAVLAAAAAALGLAAAIAAIRSLVSAGPPGIPRLSEVTIDSRTVLFTLGLAALVALACSAIPSLRIGRGSLALREGGRSGTTGHAQQRLRSGLVAAQIALALIVLAGSGLLMRTFQRLHAVQPGFDAQRVSTFWVSLPPSRYKGDTVLVQFYSRLVDRVAALPGVESVGLTSRLPLEDHGIDPNPLYPEDDPSYAKKLPPLQLQTAVNADYFRAMKIRLLAGRNFDRMEAQRANEAIVSRSTAQSFWKDSTGVAALGKRFRPLPNGREYTVIGVVADIRDTSLAAIPGQVTYFPEGLEEGNVPKRTKRTMALVVRTKNESATIATAVQGAVREIDPTLPVFDARPMTAVVSAATAQLTFIILILGGAVAVTLVLGAVGLYGVLAYVVTLRTRELGIRIALGASPREVALGLMRYGITLALFGSAFGLVIFALVARYLRTLLFGVATTDPLTLGGSAIVLLVIAATASWVPARRASRVDPAETLRAQ
ncbi:MAG: ADOP family duplicated permease [Deltaproteobacteria bacterium]